MVVIGIADSHTDREVSTIAEFPAVRECWPNTAEKPRVVLRTFHRLYPAAVDQTCLMIPSFAYLAW